MKRFAGHQKRVTLSLARCSDTCAQNPDLMAVLQKVPSLGYDLDMLSKPELELLYAEFDEDLEARVKSEFIADPEYLIDLRHADGVCPLCGHIGCRWIFRIKNTAGGQDIECGSECIVTHGLNVMGAETAEEAKRLLEARIRKEIRKLQIEAWHKDYGFSGTYFHTLETELREIQNNFELERRIRVSARCKRTQDLPKLKRFYDRSGWLGTEKKWSEWRRLSGFARANHEASALPFAKTWVDPKEVRSKAAQAAKMSEADGTVAPVAPEAPAQAQADLFAQAPAPAAQVIIPAPSDEPVQAVAPRDEPLPEVPTADAPAPVREPVPEPEAVPAQALTSFEHMARNLVFKK